MADTTWGVRVDEETKKELTELLNESGEQGKDFVVSLLTAYKLKKAEELQPIASQDIKELQTHIKRIQEIYYNLTQRIEMQLAAKDKETEDIITKKDEELISANVQNEQLKIKLQEINEKLEICYATIEEQKNRISELLETNDTTKSLVQEYKKKNDMLTGLLSEYQGYKEKVEELEKKLRQEQEAREKVEKTNKEQLEAIEKMKLQHKDELQKAKDNLVIEHKSKVLDIQTKHQDTINKIHQDYNTKIEELNAKIHDLILSIKREGKKVYRKKPDAPKMENNDDED